MGPGALPAGGERRYTQGMREIALALLAATTLLAAPAEAAPNKKKGAKMAALDPTAKKLMAEGMGNLDRGELTAAISTLNKAVRRQGTVSSYFLLGWAHYQRGFKLGSVEAADRDDAQSAIDAFEMAVSLDGKLSELPDPSRLHFTLAMCLEAVEAYDKALESYKTALTLAPQKALIPLHAARLRMKMKDEVKSLANIEMALSKARKSGSEEALRKQARRDPAFAPLIGSAIHRRAMGIADPAQDGKQVQKTKKRMKQRFWVEICDGAKLFYISGARAGWATFGRPAYAQLCGHGKYSG